MNRRNLVKLSLAGLVAGVSLPVWAQAPKAGHDFKNLRQVQSIAPHKKQVVEVFYYGCSHCYNLEPSLHDWLKTKPADVHFERVPAVFNNPNWVFMAKVYLTAQDLGIVEKSHLPFFQALHRDKLPLFNIGDIARFHSRFGVTEKQFIETFESFKVDQAFRRAQRLTQSYAVEGVPALIVNGKYLTDLTMHDSHGAVWDTVNKLLEM
jgi:thiol:disulfide interchange protein DsbA